jgi:lambda family phage tail tape measure protein
MSIGIVMDTTDVVRGEKAMERLGATTEATGKRVSVSNGQMGQFNATMTATERAAANAAKAQKAQTAETERARKAADALSIAQAELIDRVDALAAKHGKSTVAMLRADAATLGLTDKLRGQFDVLDTVVKKQTAHGFSLQSSIAKIELARIAHDGMIGSYQRMASSAFVFANASGLSAMAFTAAGAAIAGVAVIVAAFGYEVYQGHAQIMALNKAIDQTNGYVGVTTDRMRSMVNSMDLAHASTGKNTEAFTLMAASGKVAGDRIKEFGQIAVYMAHDSGQSIEDVSKELLKMTDGAGKFAVEYQKAHHFMDAATMETALELDKEGKQADAVTVILKALGDEHERMAQRVKKDMGFIGHFMEDWGRGLEIIKTKIMNIGAGAAVFDQIKGKLEQIDSANKQIEQSEKAGDTARTLRLRNSITNLTAEINVIRDKERAQKSAAANPAGAGGDGVAQEKAYLANSSYDSKAVRMQKEKDAENKAYKETIAVMEKGNLGIQEVTKAHKERLAEIEKRNTDAKKQAPSTYGIAEKGQIDTETRAMAFKAESIRSETQMNDFMYKHNMKSAEEYYAKQHDLAVEQERFNLASIGRKITAEESLKPKDDATKKRKEGTLNQLRDQLALEEQVQSHRQEFDAEQAKILPIEKEYADLTKEAAHLRNIESQQLAEIAAQERTYKIDVIDGAKAKNTVTLQYAANLQLVLDKMNALSSANPFLKGANNKEGDLAAAVQRANEGAKGSATKDPWFAMRESMKIYAKEAQESGRDIGKYMTGAFKGAEDAFVQFAQTGKLSFKSLASSIMADIERILIRKAIVGLINYAVGGTGIGGAGGTSGGNGASAGRAIGGPVAAGTRYLVGENGPETLTMGGNGFITPNGGGGSGGGSVSVNVVVNAQTGESKSSAAGGNGDANSIRAFGEMVGAKVREVIIQEKRNGGLLA